MRSQAPQGGRLAPDSQAPEHAILAVVLVLLIAVRLRLPVGLTPGLLAAAALLPVTLSVLPRARWMITFTALCVATAGWGLLLSLAVGEDGWSLSNAVTGSVRLLSIPLLAVSLVWARTIIGTRNVILLFALGSLASLPVVGINTDNAWKFSFSVPVALLALGLPRVYGHRLREFAILLALAATSVLNDSRSAAAAMLIAAALVISQRTMRSAPRRAGLVLVQLAAIALAGFFAVQAAALEGVLGENAQTRTADQVQQSGSVLLGGRPEIGASLALLRDTPWGFGPGTEVSYESLQVAKTGMAALGYEPNNRYVENYMFGNGYEVHSVIGDLGLWFGPLGLLTCVAILFVLVRGITVGIGAGAATGVQLYLALRALWDLPFSPFLSALATLPLALALCWPVRPSPRAGATTQTAPPPTLAGQRPIRPAAMMRRTIR